jgi:hypothetical protein
MVEECSHASQTTICSHHHTHYSLLMMVMVFRTDKNTAVNTICDINNMRKNNNVGSIH